MGKVCLLSDHNFLREQTIFSPEIFKNRSFEEACKEVPQIFYNALIAMSNLQNFDFDLWLFRDPKADILELIIGCPSCRVFLNKEVIANLSECDYLNKKNPFAVLFNFSWCIKDDYFHLIKNWTVQEWQEFLTQSIKSELQKNVSKAESDLKEIKEIYQEKCQKAEENFHILKALEETVVKALE